MTPTANTFEDRLLDALLDRFDTQAHPPAADLVPAHRARIRRYAIPLGCLAAAATAASVVLELGGPAPVRPVTSRTPSYALADWTKQPTPAPGAQVSRAKTMCSAAFDQNAASQAAAIQKFAPLPAGGPWNPVLVDTRGDLTLALYSDGIHTVSCLAGPSFISISNIDAAGKSPLTTNSASLEKVSIHQTSGDVYTIAVGRSGSTVTGVALARVDGSLVTATVGNGRFIAWWPDEEGVKALSVTTSAGTHNDPVDPRFARSHPQPTNKVVHFSSYHPSNQVR